MCSNFGPVVNSPNRKRGRPWLLWQLLLVTGHRGGTEKLCSSDISSQRSGWIEFECVLLPAVPLLHTPWKHTKLPILWWHRPGFSKIFGFVTQMKVFSRVSDQRRRLTLRCNFDDRILVWFLGDD